MTTYTIVKTLTKQISELSEMLSDKDRSETNLAQIRGRISGLNFAKGLIRYDERHIG